MLPFTAEALFALIELYNSAIWPAQFAACAIGAGALLLALRPVSGAGRLIAAGIAALWAWVGVAWHLMQVAGINFAAPLYATLFLLQALLLLWTGVVRGRLAFRFRGDLLGWAGLGLAALGLLYPFLFRLAGHPWPQAPLFGVAPAPTVIFTLGLLLLIEGRAPLRLAAIPVLWSLIGGATAWVLDVPQDYVLPVAGLAALALILWKNRGSA